MKVRTFVTNHMIEELKERIAALSDPRSDPSQVEAAQETVEKCKAKLAVLEEYKDLTVICRKYSAKQKDMLEQCLTNPSVKVRGGRNATPEANIDIPTFKKRAVQYGVINLQPRILEMEKVRDAANGEPELWQIKDAVLDELDWDFRDLLLEMVEETNPKNWN